jgi:transcriptional regulator with XRE-family HTH domain
MGWQMNTIDRDKISALLVKLRRSRDYSREDMSHLLGVSPRTIQRWEKGDVMPTMDDLVNISNEFNISIEELFAGETNADKELFGTDRMLTALNEVKDAPPEDVLKGVRQSVDAFVKDAEQFDDLTMLCLTYKGSRPSA